MAPSCKGCTGNDWAFEKVYKLGRQIAIDLSCNDCGTVAVLLVSPASGQANMTQYCDDVQVVDDFTLKTAGQAGQAGIDDRIPF